MGYSCYLGTDIQIGNDVMFASEVALVGGDHVYDDPEVKLNESGSEEINPVIIGDNVWVGHGAIILAGVTIEDGAIIGAGSVVTKNVKKDSVYAGNPARFIKNRFEIIGGSDPSGTFPDD